MRYLPRAPRPPERTLRTPPPSLLVGAGPSGRGVHPPEAPRRHARERQRPRRTALPGGPCARRAVLPSRGRPSRRLPPYSLVYGCQRPGGQHADRLPATEEERHVVSHGRPQAADPNPESKFAEEIGEAAGRDEQ